MIDINEVADVTVINTHGILTLDIVDPYNSKTALITVDALQKIVDLINELNGQLKELRSEAKKT
jgi:hypothetical protein